VNQEARNNSRTGFLITESNISFEINKDDSDKANKGFITITNTSDDIVDYLEANSGNSVAVILEAGYSEDYGGQLKTIFKGNVERIEDVFDKETRQTKLILGDASVNIREALSSRYYPSGTPVKTVLRDLTKDMGLSVGNMETIDDSKMTRKSYSWMGKSSSILKELSKELEADYSIQDGQVYIIKYNGLLRQRVAYISETSGLLGSPEPLSQSEGKAQTDDAPVKGIRFRCLLDGAIKPGSTVYVKSRKYDGAYKVTKVTHKGEYEGSNWESNVEAIETPGSVAVNNGGASG
jgi:hypothetical protein